MNYILFDDHNWDQMLPLTFTRPVAELRVGILKIREKWECLLNAPISLLSREYLRIKYPPCFEDDNILINSSILPDNSFLNTLKNLEKGDSIFKDARMLAVRLTKSGARSFNPESPVFRKKINPESPVRLLDRPWHIFSENGNEIVSDFGLITRGKRSAILSATNNLISPENIFAEEGVKAEYVTLNASGGLIYLGKNSEIMEGSVIRGSFALCENSRIKMSAKIYGPTTIGPESVAGGEIKNSVIQGYSNKGHDGFLGNSVLGEWCNIGADTNTSNLKNTYADIKLWSYPDKKMISTGLKYCGLIMADHSKCGINTMFNSGTVVGVNSNIFGTGFMLKFIPSFSWGGSDGFSLYSLSKAFEVAEKVMSFRNIDFDEKEKALLSHIFEMTREYRTF